ncbi:hypothetical protein E3N88_18078 [Mikania micrantha]|uniref:Uncharacterized protein n=1 Tax=Mikania micrantha TaxID=192012 RepID=A0A5N6NTL1_9ASTR|nr:hypothetical protein E3N88_18078 [Mikania micrantha]
MRQKPSMPFRMTPQQRASENRVIAEVVQQMKTIIPDIVAQMIQQRNEILNSNTLTIETLPINGSKKAKGKKFKRIFKTEKPS